MGIPSDRQFLGMVAYRLRGWFVTCPTNRNTTAACAGWSSTSSWPSSGSPELIAAGRTRLADGVLIGCANYAGCASKSHFAGHAGYGYCPTKSLFVWGMRLVVVTHEKGVPVGYDLVAPGDGEREPPFRLAQAQPDSVLFTDKGLWGAEYKRTIELLEVELITPERHRLGERPSAEVVKAAIR